LPSGVDEPDRALEHLHASQGVKVPTNVVNIEVYTPTHRLAPASLWIVLNPTKGRAYLPLIDRQCQELETGPSLAGRQWLAALLSPDLVTANTAGWNRGEQGVPTRIAWEKRGASHVERRCEATTGAC
jgi:hypothetical protein